MRSEPKLATAEPSAHLSRQQLRSLIASMCDLWDGLLTSGRGTEYRLDVLDVNRAVAIRTHTHHAVGLARAMLAVDDISTGIELVPLARLILECGVTTAWLLVTPKSGHTLVNDGAKSRKTALDALQRRGVDANPGRDQAIETLENLGGLEFPKGYQFEQRCNALKGGDTIYLVYRVQSSLSHAGLGIADHYMVEDPTSPIGMVFDRNAPDTTRTAQLGVAACMLLMALVANETAQIRPTRSTQLARIAKRLGVGTAIARSDGYETPPREPAAKS